MSAESNIVSPASRQTSTRRVASLTSLVPNPLKTGLFPPNVPVPKVSTGTLRPDRPRVRYSIDSAFILLRSAFDSLRTDLGLDLTGDFGAELGVAEGADGYTDLAVSGVDVFHVN